MGINKNRHILLKVLEERDNGFHNGKHKSIAVGYEELYRHFKCNQTKLKKISSELFQCKEIGTYNYNGIRGLYIEELGSASYYNRKYLKKRNNSFMITFKNIFSFVRTFFTFLFI